MRQGVVSALVGAVAAIPAAMLTVVFYLIWPLGEPFAKAVSASLPWSSMLLPAAIPLGGLVGISWAISRERGRLVRAALLIVSAALAGALTAWWATHASIHISTRVATLEGALAWAIVAAVVGFASRNRRAS